MTKKISSARRECVLTIVLLAMGAWTLGCGGGGAGSVAPPSPPPPSTTVTVSVTPTSGTVWLGGTLSFTASVSNSSDTTVVWSVNGTLGGSRQAGTISADGLYTSPADLPSGGTVQVTATSHADSSKFATVNVTIASDIAVSMTPSVANVELGATQAVQATVHSQGQPDTAIRWTLSGGACPSSCGSVDANGTYTAPQILPSSTTVNLTATSAADPSKQSTASLTITSHFTLKLSVPTNIAAGSSSSLAAVLTPVSGSNPNMGMSWAVSGTGCSGSACGVLSVTTTQAAGGVPLAATAMYTAPLSPPQPDMVIITVTPLADPSKQAQAGIVIQGGAGIAISPLTATVAANHRVTLTAAQGGSSGASFNWSVNAIAGGNSALGQICVTGSNPCQSYPSGTATQVGYLAPGSIPSPNPVSVTVTSSANPTLLASAQITVMNHVIVSVLPNSVSVAPLGTQTFSASVTGSSNQNVIWQVQGAGCGTGSNCGTVDAMGNYTAPATPPSPDALQVVAISQDDPTQSGIANVFILNGPNITTLHPASVYAGGTNGFTVQVTGGGFLASSPGPGSTLIVAGTARVTTCATANSCSAPLTSMDVAKPGSVMVAVKNPNGAVSNSVQLVMIAAGGVDDAIALSNSAPAVTGKDITVVEPTTAGIDTNDDNLDLDVAAIGAFSPSNNSCSLGGNPISLIRPASGTNAADICLFSQSGFDTSMTYTVSGPGDVAVIAKQPAGLGIIHLTLQIPATAAPGARTLFIQNANLDKTAASGVLQIQ